MFSPFSRPIKMETLEFEVFCKKYSLGFLVYPKLASQSGECFFKNGPYL